VSLAPATQTVPRSGPALEAALNAALADEGLTARWVVQEMAVVITGGPRLVWARVGGSAPHVANVAVAHAGPGSPWSSFYAMGEVIAAVRRLAAA